MATPVSEVVKVNWKQVFPWLALFRTLGLALHVRQICVGLAAVCLISLGHRLLLDVTTLTARDGMELHGPLLRYVGTPFVDTILAPWIDVLWPILVQGSSGLDTNNQAQLWWSVIRVAMLLIWAGAIGGLAGGILVRRAAFEFCREESLSLTASARYVGQRWMDYLSAPGLPLAIVAGLGLVLAAVGLFAFGVPLGNVLVSATFFIWLAIALVMAALFSAVCFGWPMMIAAVSINGGDGFDALSRGFGFVLDRWRYYGCCLLIMIAYGTLIVGLLEVFLLWGLAFLQSGLLLGGQNARSLPELLPQQSLDPIVRLLVKAFGYSYFWANMTVIYLVLRKSVDNAQLDDVYVEGAGPKSDELQALLNPTQPAGPTLLPIIDQPPR